MECKAAARGIRMVRYSSCYKEQVRPECIYQARQVERCNTPTVQIAHVYFPESPSGHGSGLSLSNPYLSTTTRSPLRRPSSKPPNRNSSHLHPQMPSPTPNQADPAHRPPSLPSLIFGPPQQSHAQTLGGLVSTCLSAMTPSLPIPPSPLHPSSQHGAATLTAPKRSNTAQSACSTAEEKSAMAWHGK